MRYTKTRKEIIQDDVYNVKSFYELEDNQFEDLLIRNIAENPQQD